jgi:signal peptidase I
MWWIAVAGALAAGAGVLWLRRRVLVVRVMGQSMLPTMDDGQKLLARRTSRAPVTGTIVVVRPFGDSRLVVKRVAATAGETVPAEVAEPAGIPPGGTVPRGSLVVLGDNAGASTDSRTWGLLPVSSVVAVVVRKIRNGTRAEPEWRLMDERVPLAELGEKSEFGEFTFRFRDDAGPH